MSAKSGTEEVAAETEIEMKVAATGAAEEATNNEIAQPVIPGRGPDRTRDHAAGAHHEMAEEDTIAEVMTEETESTEESGLPVTRGADQLRVARERAGAAVTVKRAREVSPRTRKA